MVVVMAVVLEGRERVRVVGTGSARVLAARYMALSSAFTSCWSGHQAIEIGTGGSVGGLKFERKCHSALRRCWPDVGRFGRERSRTVDLFWVKRIMSVVVGCTRCLASRAASQRAVRSDSEVEIKDVFSTRRDVLDPG